VANPEEKNAYHLAPPPAYLLSTTHSKDVRFPWVTLYKYNCILRCDTEFSDGNSPVFQMNLMEAAGTFSKLH
jgi:hypothetical protein